MKFLIGISLANFFLQFYLTIITSENVKKSIFPFIFICKTFLLDQSEKGTRLSGFLPKIRRKRYFSNENQIKIIDHVYYFGIYFLIT